MSDINFTVHARSASPAKTIVKARNFEIIVDEPESLGGSDSAANPVEYVLAAFAGCLNVMCHVVAKEMKFDLKSLEIKLSGNLNPAKVLGQKTDDRAGYKAIDVEIKADTDADSATLEKWLEQVESRCPVSDNLSNITPISFQLK